jgi:hypothetical protein
MYLTPSGQIKLDIGNPDAKFSLVHGNCCKLFPQVAVSCKGGYNKF